jgi:hypothetical protein
MKGKIPHLNTKVVQRRYLIPIVEPVQFARTPSDSVWRYFGDERSGYLTLGVELWGDADAVRSACNVYIFGKRQLGREVLFPLDFRGGDYCHDVF